MSAIQTPDFSLSRNNFGELVMTLTNSTVCGGVVLVCAFPVPAADEGLSLMNTDGRELVWIMQPDALPTPMHTLIEAELGAQELIPEIRTIVDVLTYVTPSIWTAQIDCGQTDLTLHDERSVHRLTGTTLLISDSHGIHYLICDPFTLDKRSRKILDRFP